MSRFQLFLSVALTMLFLQVCYCWSQNANQSIDFSELDWLAGTWKTKTTRGFSYEKWTKVSPLTFEGLSFRVSGADTIMLEFIRLEQFGKEIFYTPKVAHNPYPVPFKLVGKTDRGFTFENPEHDFPQTIIYNYKKDDTLHVRVEGSQNGKSSGFDVLFEKIK